MQSSPVIVQGTIVNPAVSATPPPPAQSNYPQRGEKQETKCNDVVFAILFYITVIAVVAVAGIYGPGAVSPEDDGGDQVTNEYQGYIIATVIVVVLSFFAAGGALMIMMCIPETLIKMALIFVVVLAGIWMLLMFASGQVVLAIFGLFIFAVSLCYAKVAWARIPFATANLVTSITAIRANCGVTVYAYILTILAGVWSLVWAVASIGIFSETSDCEADDECTDPNYGYLFLLLVAFYFVQQVLVSCVHTTVAGTVGSWWFDPMEGSPVNNAFLRTMTTSFGSICFGSLIVAILEALRMLARAARDQDDGNGFLLCLAECILGCLASLMEYFNKWAFIYVGLYGYPYLQAGKQVFTLFQNRGWEAIITDDLVNNVLFLMSLVTGGFMGGVAVIIEISSGLFDNAGGNSKAVAFVLGFVVGMSVTSVLMSTVGSGVNAVIVLFAEAPADFERNHRELSLRMRTVWHQTYPNSLY